MSHLAGKQFHMNKYENPQHPQEEQKGICAEETRKSNRVYSPVGESEWRGRPQPAPVLSPGGIPGTGSLVGCSAWGRTESDTTEATQQQQQRQHIMVLNSGTCFQGSLL